MRVVHFYLQFAAVIATRALVYATSQLTRLADYPHERAVALYARAGASWWVTHRLDAEVRIVEEERR
jgi:hypothetical protein